MAHFWGPSDSQLVPKGVVYYEKQDDPHAPHEVWKIDIPTGTRQVAVNLYGAASLKVLSNNTDVIANPIQESSAGDNRVLRLDGASAGTAMIEVTDSSGAHWIHLQVHVIDPDPTRAGQSGTPQGSSGSTSAATPEPVAELLGLIDAKFTDDELADDKKIVTGFLSARKAVNIVKVFLYGFRALAGRNLPTRNAIFLPCHTFEAGFGAAGPNASIGNWFSVQVLPKGDTAALFEAFRKRGAVPESGARGNAGNPSGVFNPVFLNRITGQINIPAMINAQLDLQYGAPQDANVQPWVVESIAPWKPVGRALARNDITARQFGAAIGGAGYANGGGDYGTTFAASYTHVSGALKWFLGGSLSGASQTAKTWAAAALATAAPQG